MKSKPRKATILRLPVREAKNRFSELVRQAAKGKEVIITSHGEPRARVGPVMRGPSQPFEVDWKWLRTMKVADPQTPSESLIRLERDERD